GSSSATEYSLDGNPGLWEDQGALRSVSDPLTDLTAAQLQADRRRLVTTYNSERKVEAASNVWRRPMPEYLKAFGAPDFRLDPAKDSASDIANLFRTLLSDTTAGIHYEDDQAEAIRAGNALAANLA